MVYRKSSRAGRRVGRRRNFKRRYTRRSAKQMVKPKFGGVLKQPVHYYTRFQDGGTITASGASATFGVIYFELAALPNYAEFTALYDFYRINAVQVRFIPVSNITQPTTSANYVATFYDNRIFTVMDYNDRSPPTTLDQLRQYSNCKQGTNNRVHKRFIYPKPLVTMDEDSGSGGSYGIAQVQKIPWVSTQSNQCEWYGIKYGIEHASTALGTLYKLEFKFYLSFKGVN